MNTVKYRALAKDGTWRYGFYPCLNVDMGNTKYPMDIFWNNFLSAFRRETLGQWTGLLDKLGKDIYEGDILLVNKEVDQEDDMPSLLTFRATIDFQHGAFWFTGINYNMTDCLWFQWNEEDFEVIGNIYENPELLEVSK